MESKEKLQRAFNFEEGPIPIDFGAAPVTGMHCSIVEKLRTHYGLEKRPVKICCPYQMLGAIESDLRTCLSIDTDYIWSDVNMFGTTQTAFREYTTPWGQKVLLSTDLSINTLPDGSLHTYPRGDDSFPPSGCMPQGSFFFDAIKRQDPIYEDALDPQDNLEEFQPIREESLRYYEKSGSEVDHSKWIIGNFGGTAIGDVSLIPAPQLPFPKGIRDVEEWYVSTAVRQGYLHKVFERQIEIALGNLEKIYDILGNSIDAIYVCGNDLGTQIGPLCSVETYKDLYKPYHTRINDWIHKNTEWKTFKHSCGAIEPFIPHLIDAGFDVINPVQKTAAGMDLKELKKNTVTRSYSGEGEWIPRILCPSENRKRFERRCWKLARSWHGGRICFQRHPQHSGTNSGRECCRHV